MSPQCASTSSADTCESTAEMVGASEKDGFSNHSRATTLVKLEELDSPTSRRGIQWESTALRYGPLMGIACLMLAFSSIFASFAVLYSSNSTPEGAWAYNPATYIAVLTAVANQSIRYAACQGVVIFWWLKAMKGTTLREIHYDWAAGTEIWSALASLRQLRILASACLASTLVAFHGPLLQQSSTIKEADIPPGEEVQLNVTIGQEIPSGFSGVYYWDTKLERFRYDFLMLTAGSAYKDFLNHEPMDDFATGCSGLCAATIRGPALSIKDCITTTGPVDFSQVIVDPPVWPIDFMFQEEDYANQTGKVGLYSHVQFVITDNKEILNITTIHTETQDCAGTFNYTSCLLESAIAEYNITFENTKISLPDSVSHPQIIAIANNTGAGEKNLQPRAAALAGLDPISTAYADFLGRVTTDFDLLTYGSDGTSFAFQHQEDVHSACSSTTDPFDDLLDMLNRVMFRMGLMVPNAADMINPGPIEFDLTVDEGLPMVQSVTGYRTGKRNVYQTNFIWFAAAAAVEALCIALVAPLYWGWWRLGRAVSFSPLEMAKAFDAPLLAGCNSNMTAEDMAKHNEEVEVRYGVRGEEGVMSGEAKKLAFAEARHVYRPLDDFEFEA